MTRRQVDESLDLSIVVSGRNDDWMGTFDRVTPFACRCNVETMDRAGARFEWIFVEWAPLQDRALLSHRLTAIDPRVRCLAVPKAIHDGFSPRLPFLQYHARNVGVRRARGRIVLATNADVLLTPAIARELLRLEENTLLRAPRWDVDQAILDCRTLDEVLAFAGDAKRLVARHDLHRVDVRGKKLPYWTNGAGDFIAMSRRAWELCEGFHQRVDASMGVDAEMIHQAIARRLAVRVVDDPVYHVDHPEQQPGRLHFPPYSRHGYVNPPDWGLAGLAFEEIAPRIAQCTIERAGSFVRTVNPLEASSAISDPLILDATPRRWHPELVHVAGSLDAAMLGFLDHFVLSRRREFFIHDDGSSTATRELNRRPALRWPGGLTPISGVLYWVAADSPAEDQLRRNGAVEGLHYASVDVDRRTTLSFLRRRLEDRRPPLREVVLFGFGRNGVYLAEQFAERPLVGGVAAAAYDDDPAAAERAIAQNLRMVSADELCRRRSDRVILTTPARPKDQQQAARRLAAAGLRRGSDFYIHLGRSPRWDSNCRFWNERRFKDAASPVYLDPILAALTPEIELDDEVWRRRHESGAVSMSVSIRRSIAGRSMRWLSAWEPMCASLGDVEASWLGVRSTRRLESEQAHATAVGRMDGAGDGSRRGGFRATILRSLAAECVGRRIVHVGAPRSRALRDLAVDAPASDGGIVGVELIRTPWGELGDLESPRRRSTPRSAWASKIRFLQETPIVAAMELTKASPLGLLVFSDVEDAWQLREGYEELTPLLADGGVLAFVGWCGVYDRYVERFLEEILPTDARFEPVVATEELMLLRRVQLAPADP